MNCPYCGNEITDEDATFCPKCGRSLLTEEEPPQNSTSLQKTRTDLLLASAILTIISAAFVASLGCIAVYQNIIYTNIYGTSMASMFQGFLIFGIADIVFSVFGILGGMYMLKRKRLKISILGIAFLIVSVIATFISIYQYQYALLDITITDFTLFSEISVIIFSIFSMVLVFSSRDEFA